MFLFTRATLCVERVFATVTCLCPLQPVLYKRKELASWFLYHLIALWIQLLQGMTRRKIRKGSPQARAICETGWVRTGDFGDFSTYKPPYLRNGARCDQGYYWTLIGDHISTFVGTNIKDLGWPWTDLEWPLRVFYMRHVFWSPTQKYEWR